MVKPGAFRHMLSQESIRVFVEATLPGALRVTEVDFDIGLN